MADTREILLKLLGRETVSAAANKAAGGLENLGDAADDAARDTRGLDRELEQATRSVEELRREIARTGNLELFKDLNRSERNLKRLGRLRDTFGDAGEDAALGFSARFSQRIGPLIGSAPISPPILAAVGAAAPGVAALVSAAVSGGAAAGAVGIGTALASKRTEVSKAFGDLGTEIMSGLVVDAKPMAEPLIEATRIIREEFRDLRPEIQGVFSDAAGYVEPLARGLAGMGRELAPGLREAVREAEPVVDVLTYQLPRAGRATSDALQAVTEDSENAAAALSTLMTGAELGIQATGNSLGLLNKALPFTSGLILKVNDLLTENDRKAAEAAAAAEKQAIAEARRANAVARSADEIEGMNQALREAPGEALSMEQANLRMEQSGRALGETIKDNNRTIKNQQDRLLANKAALFDYTSDTQAAAEATRRQTGSQQAANNVLDAGRRKFLAAAAAAGVGAKEARNLADKLFGIPGKRQTDIHVNKAAAERALREFEARARAATRAREMRIRVSYTRPDQSGALGAVGQLGMAEGGLITGGIRGKDSVPILAMPGEGVLSLKGMRALGGKAALDALNSGRAVATPARPGVAGTVVHIEQLVVPANDPGTLVRALQTYARRNGPIRGIT